MEEKNNSHSDNDSKKIDFLTYVTSLAFQTMVFLGEIPSPATKQIEKNLKQAKFLIDTLILIREKTKGNLNSQEDNMINASIYELQMKYVELTKNDGAKG